MLLIFPWRQLFREKTIRVIGLLDGGMRLVQVKREIDTTHNVIFTYREDGDVGDTGDVDVSQPLYKFLFYNITLEDAPPW